MFPVDRKEVDGPFWKMTIQPHKCNVLHHSLPGAENSSSIILFTDKAAARWAWSGKSLAGWKPSSACRGLGRGTGKWWTETQPQSRASGGLHRERSAGLVLPFTAHRETERPAQTHSLLWDHYVCLLITEIYLIRMSRLNHPFLPLSFQPLLLCPAEGIWGGWLTSGPVRASSVCPGSQEGKPHPGGQQAQDNQPVKRQDSPAVSSVGAASPRAVLGPTI